MSGLFRRLVLLALAGSMLSCSDSQERTEKISVAVTIPPYEYLVSKIGGKNIKVLTSIPVGVTPHHFEPTPKMIQSISNADYYLTVGGNMEFEQVWLDKLTGVNNKLKVHELSENIDYIQNDPHIWLSPEKLIIISKNIFDFMLEILPGNRESITENYNSLVDSIKMVQNELIHSFKKVESKKLLVYHGSWTYFGNEFGFEQISIEAGSKTASAKEFAEILTKVKSANIPVIFIDPQHSKSLAEVIAKDLGIELESIDPIPSELLSNFIDVKNKIMKYYK